MTTTCAKTINWDLVDTLATCGCNGVQIASRLGVCPETLYRHTVSEKNVTFAVYSQEKKASGDTLLFEKQFEVALDKNVTMLIWLGKQRGQKEPDKAISKEDANMIAQAIKDGSLLAELTASDKHE
jgi:hypothetical protein